MTADLAPAPAGHRRRNARYTPLAVDGPLPADMVRAVPAIRRDPLGYLRGVTDRYGDLVAFPMPRTPVLLVNDPAGAARVLRDNHRAWGKATLQYRALSAVTGAGLLTADGDAWRHRRRLAQPAFRHGALDGVAAQSVAAAEALRATWEAAGPDVPVDADAAALRAMLAVVGRTLFAADLAPEADRVVGAVDAALHAVVRRSASPLALGPLGRLPTPSRRRLRRAVATLDDVAAEVVEGRRQVVGHRRQLAVAQPQLGLAQLDPLDVGERAARVGTGVLLEEVALARQLGQQVVAFVAADRGVREPPR